MKQLDKERKQEDEHKIFLKKQLKSKSQEPHPGALKQYNIIKYDRKYDPVLNDIRENPIKKKYLQQMTELSIVLDLKQQKMSQMYSQQQLKSNIQESENKKKTLEKYLK